MSIILYNQCPLCNSNNIQSVFYAKDYTVSPEDFEIVQCKDCTLRFTQNVPDQQSIGKYYKSENYISHTNTSKGFINKMYQAVRRRTMKQKVKIVQQQTGLITGNLLDIGSGTGTFLNAMKNAGWQITGLEPDEDARKNAEELYGIIAQPSEKLFSLHEQAYDAVTMWHVLEHVHELHQYIDQLKKILKPKGRIIIAVPNYTSKDAADYQQFWAAYDVPRHLYHFSPKAMDKLMSLHQLKVTQHLPMWFDSFYVDMLSSKYKNGHTNYVSAFVHGMSSNLHAMNNIKECCSVIYVIEQV
ncbi:MAG TPA: class I SAM-dependent methyltransferase [Arachidicoccus sp.]